MAGGLQGGYIIFMYFNFMIKFIFCYIISGMVSKVPYDPEGYNYWFDRKKPEIEQKTRFCIWFFETSTFWNKNDLLHLNF